MGLGAIDEDVQFDDQAADALSTACDQAAGALEGQTGSRNAWRAEGLVDFQGFFAELFALNGQTQMGDATLVTQRLREVATGVRQLKTEAANEQTRRETARAWQEERDNRSQAEKIRDGVVEYFGGKQKPPVGPPATPIVIEVSAVARERQELSGSGASGGTSSARPDALRTFATNTRAGDGELSGHTGRVRSTYEAFTSRCKWGTLNAAGVVTGFEQYVTANGEDARWADTVAGAFEAAGGSGGVSTVSNAALGAALEAAGVSASRQELTIEPAQIYGLEQTSGYADDPVNTATGNFVFPEVDLAFTGGCSGLAFDRTYNSLNTQVGAFGPGWSSWTESRLVLEDDVARWVLPEGRHIIFPRMGTGWDRAVGDSYWLQAETSPASTTDADTPSVELGGLVVSDGEGGRWRFTAGGQFSWVSRGAGTRVDALYDASGRLAGLAHERGRAIEVCWDDARDRVTGLRSSDGREVAHTYDEAGRLVSVAGVSGTRTYGWDEAGLLATVTDGDGVVEVTNTYDEDRRVATQLSSFGRTSRYTYLPGRVTEVADEDGTRSNTWIADERGRLIGVIDSDGKRQSTSYDRWGGRVMVTQRDGGLILSEFDDRGHLVRRVTPEGADVQWGYDEFDRVVTAVAESGSVTTLEYADDGDRNPSVVVDPAGGRTELEWANGLLTRAIDPTGVTLTYTYDVHGDLVAMSDAAGNTARMERNEAGQVVALVTPTGSRTTFRYDEHERVASRRDPDGAIWRFEYTGAGRLTVVVDPDGARTEVEYGVHGQESASVDPLGRTITRVLDDLGNLASVELPDGSVWKYTHDALSRLVEITNPVGGVTRTEYDASGSVIAQHDPTGASQHISIDRADGTVRVSDAATSWATRTDPLGRLVRVESEGDGESTYVYDACGRVVEALDPNGGLTLLRRDLAGRVIEHVSPMGAVTTYEYDACGHLAAATDPAGGRSTYEYDADGRQIAQVFPSGERAWTEYDVCGRVVKAFTPGRGLASYGWDKCGRLVRSRDPLWGARRFTYDAAGQLVAVTNGNGGVTRYEYDSNGRACRITDPLGGVTTREWDALNHLVAETDPLGRTTRAGYDAAGRQTWQQDPAGGELRLGYDQAGLVTTTSADGRVVSSIARDIPTRTVIVTDTTGPDTVTHTLEWDRLGNLIRHERGGQVLAWTYDSDGRRTSLIDVDGSRTGYDYDQAGRLASIDHPVFGRATFGYDPSGNLTSAATGDLLQTWHWDQGVPVAHSVTGPDGAQSSRIERDGDGRIVAVTRGGETTTYTYDEASQLTGAATGDRRLAWRYDTAGRLVEHLGPDGRSAYTYDAAGQLIEVTGPSGHVIHHAYDAAGRRTSTDDGRGQVRSYQWATTGALQAITDATSGGQTRRDVQVDALGQLTRIDSTTIRWDTASGFGAMVGIGDTPVLAAGPATAIGQGWTTPGWRPARTDQADPWNIPPATSVADGLGITATGTLTLDGPATSAGPGGVSGASAGQGTLEWLGARLYDAATAGFLTQDPLEPVTGAGWSANPYSYAGNNPLTFTDPTGLHPLTDAELDTWVSEHSSNLSKAVHAAGEWWDEYGDWVVGGVLIVGGIVCTATCFGGPLGAALVAAGTDTIVQKATTGSVSYRQVAVAGALGGVGGAAVSSFGFAARGGGTFLRFTADSAITEGFSGGGMGLYTYQTGPGPHTVAGALKATTTGTLRGGFEGALAGGTAFGFGRGLDAFKHSDTYVDAPYLLANTPPTPTKPVAAPPPTAPAFIADANGTVIPTDRARFQSGLNAAGFPQRATSSLGTEYTLPSGTRVTFTEASGDASLRASFTNSTGATVNPFTDNPA